MIEKIRHLIIRQLQREIKQCPEGLSAQDVDGSLAVHAIIALVAGAGEHIRSLAAQTYKWERPDINFAVRHQILVFAGEHAVANGGQLVAQAKHQQERLRLQPIQVIGRGPRKSILHPSEPHRIVGLQRVVISMRIISQVRSYVGIKM